MAVIVEGMYEPTSCKDCYLSAGYGCEIMGRVLTTKEMEQRQKDCPVKSVEGLLEYIRKWSYPVHYDRNSVEHGMTMTGIEQAIREYCEIKEE